MAPIGEAGGPGGAAADVAAGMGDEAASGAGAAGAAGAGKKGSYVPPALRGDRAGAGERMGGKYGERDDLATLRVTNVSSFPLRQAVFCRLLYFSPTFSLDCPSFFSGFSIWCTCWEERGSETEIKRKRQESNIC